MPRSFTHIVFHTQNAPPLSSPGSEGYRWENTFKFLVDEDLDFLGPVTHTDEPYAAYSQAQTSVKCTANSLVPFNGTLPDMYNKKGCYSRSEVRTPRALQAARRHFQCPTLSGVALEDEGKQGSRMSHLEARVYMENGMTAAGGRLKFTETTWSFMEDTGHYRINPNASRTAATAFGFGLGCKFAQGDCVTDWRDLQAKGRMSEGYSVPPSHMIKSTSNSNHHLDGYQSTCSWDRLAVTEVTEDATAPKYPWRTHGSPGKTFRTRYGATFGNGCPVAHGHTFPRYTCATTSKAVRAYIGDAYSNTSRCFMSSLFKSGYTWGGKSLPDGYAVASPTCREEECGANGTLYVTVGNSKVMCPPLGGNISVPGFGGVLHCPPAAATCGLYSALTKFHNDVNSANSLRFKGATPAHALGNATLRLSGPPSPKASFASRPVLASALNATVQSRVTLSLRKEHLRAGCGPQQEEKGPETRPKHDFCSQAAASRRAWWCGSARWGWGASCRPRSPC